MGLKRSRHDSTSSSEEASLQLTTTTTHNTHNTSRSPSLTPSIKIIHLDTDTNANNPGSSSALPAIMKCSLPPHAPLTFPSYDDYEVHYQKMHVNRCSECRKNFPDEHFLNLHIAENHDPINAAKRDRGEKTYACLLPTCPRLCSTPPKRRLHCIDAHAFPRMYDFYIVNDGIDRRSSMLRPPQHRRRSSTLNSVTSNPNLDGEGGKGGGGRKRGESLVSTKGSGVGESMEIVRNDDERDEEMEENGSENEENVKQRTPVKLRGRGGFGRPRGGRGRGRGRGRGGGAPTANPESSRLTSTTDTVSSPPDPMESLTSSMSALKFIPHSVRVARGRGRGRGST